MKQDITYKNLLDVILGVFFISWLFFLCVYWGNGAGIFAFTGFAGKFIVTAGRIYPVLILYMFLTVWGDIKSPGDFFEQLTECPSKSRAFGITLGFLILHALLVRFFSVPRGGGFDLLSSFAWAILYCGSMEVVWTGFFLKAFSKGRHFAVACMLNGFLYFLYLLPVMCIDGAMEEEVPVVYYFLYCALTAFLVGCIYRVTESVPASVLVRCVFQTQAWLYRDMMLGSPAVYFLFIVEILLFSGILFFMDRKEKHFKGEEKK